MNTPLNLALLLAFALPAFAKETAPKPAPERPIDLVICLDTSGSMEGLLESAKQKLWDIVNELTKAQPKPHLRVGLYAYGTPDYGASAGWVRKLHDLSDDLDSVYAKLSPLKTNGGDEYVARVVRDATLDQPWSPDRSALKIIVVAGNEPATQDPTHKTADVCRDAIARGIVVNTIYCGPASSPEADGWRDAARIADGQFASIDQQNGTVVINTPFDKKLAELGADLNGTYLAYGRAAGEGMARQAAADRMSLAASAPAAAARAVAKSGGNYRNAGWDLVDASKEKDFRLESIRDEDLPEAMRAQTPREREAHLKQAAAKRAELQKQVAEIDAKRQAWIRDEMKRSSNKGDQSFDAAVRQAVRDQARQKGFAFAE
jgi:hypothetical protein